MVNLNLAGNPIGWKVKVCCKKCIPFLLLILNSSYAAVNFWIDPSSPSVPVLSSKIVTGIS